MNIPKILIVEDEKIIALDLQMQLEDLGYYICGNVQTAFDAIEKARKEHPDIVLMDIRLKGEKDGTYAVNEIHKYMNVPVIYLTANADVHTVRKAGKTNYGAMLFKPVDEFELKSMIEEFVNRGS